MPDEIIIRFSVQDDGTPKIEKLNKTLGKTKDATRKIVPSLESAKQSVAGFVSANAALIGVLIGVGVAIGKLLKDHIAYGNQVRQLSALSGESTESTSRFIQVLDDYKISADEALTATRALTKEGHTPSIETLAKLSDQYLALNSVEAKNEFVLKNLGRGGLQWVEVLNKGSKALLEQGAAVDKNLILTKKMVDDSRKAEIAMDNWNDAIAAVKAQLAVSLLPSLTKFVNSQLAVTRALEIQKEQYGHAGIGLSGYADALKQANEEQEAAANAMLESAEATDSNTSSLEENAKANEELAKATSDRISSMISLIDSMQSAEEGYTEKSKDLAKDRADAEHELIELWAEASEAQRKGMPVGDELAENIQEAIIQLDEIKAKEAELATERDKNTLKFISNILAENLARDGWTEKEFDAFAAQQEAWGLWSADVVEKAKAAWQEADRVTASINGIPSNKVTTITVVTQQQAIQMTNAQTLGGYAYGSPQYQHIARPGRDTGGIGIAGQEYMIGVPEKFTPSTNGNFTPNSRGENGNSGNVYNIVVNNPKRETAENSIRAALKNLSYLGAAQ